MSARSDARNRLAALEKIARAEAWLNGEMKKIADWPIDYTIDTAYRNHAYGLYRDSVRLELKLAGVL